MIFNAFRNGWATQRCIDCFAETPLDELAVVSREDAGRQILVLVCAQCAEK